MIKWICDICKKEIAAPDHPVQFTANYETRNRNLEGFGETTYLIDHIHLHKHCADNLAQQIARMVKTILPEKDNEPT